MFPLVVTLLGGWFANEPIADQVELGKKIAGKYDRDDWERRLRVPPASEKRADISEIYGEDRKVIGTWSDGLRKLDTEWVIHLSPELLSRWLGFLSLREGWSDGEIEGRWQKLRQDIGNKPVFIVILSAFPKQELLGLGEARPAETNQMFKVKMVFEQDSKNIEAVSFDLLETRADNRSQLDRVPWWQLTRLNETLTGLFESSYEEPLIPRGEYYRNWRWVVPSTDLAPKPFYLKILSERKIRYAQFTPWVSIADTSRE